MGISLSKLGNWVFGSPASLPGMRLGPEDGSDNPLMIQFFTWDTKFDRMSWWQHVEAELPTLARMGFTQIWLPPPNKAAERVRTEFEPECDMGYIFYLQDGRGYDAYDLWDLGEFNQKGSIKTRWGSREELLSACNVAKECGVDILVDAVLNHKLGGDRTEQFTAVPVQSQNRLKVSGPERDIEGWTAFDFTNRGDKYSKLKWNQSHFTGVDWDERAQENKIFRITGSGHKGWSSYVDRELGNYDYLLGVDIDHRHPEVQKDFLDWGPWIIETMGATGFRLDAIKHIDRRFLLNFIQSTRRKAGLKRMFVVSEYWSGNLKMILPYIRAFRGETSFFDVPLHMNFHHASTQGHRFDLRRIFQNTIVGVKPGDAVTFVDNHDTVEGQTLQSWVASNFKLQAYAIILLRGYGHPCVFYGDLYPNTECYDRVVASGLRILIEARRRFAYGQTIDYLVQKNCIGFVRTGDASHPGCAVILSNTEDSENFIRTLKMNVGMKYAGSAFESFMQNDGRVEIDEEGWGTFSCFANHLQVWVPAQKT